jgi:hypothetical protein
MNDFPLIPNKTNLLMAVIAGAIAWVAPQVLTCEDLFKETYSRNANFGEGVQQAMVREPQFNVALQQSIEPAANRVNNISLLE